MKIEEAKLTPAFRDIVCMGSAAPCGSSKSKRFLQMPNITADPNVPTFPTPDGPGLLP